MHPLGIEEGRWQTKATSEGCFAESVDKSSDGGDQRESRGTGLKRVAVDSMIDFRESRTKSAIRKTFFSSWDLYRIGTAGAMEVTTR